MARINVIGASGTGKSHFAGTLLETIVPDFDIAVHFDIEDEEGGLCMGDDPLYQTYRVEVEEAERIHWVNLIANHKKIRLVPEGFTVDEQQRLYAVICYSVMKLCKDHKPEWTAFVSCDEAHNLVNQSAFDQRVERMITGGRKHGVECLHISQRPQLLHTTVISQSDKRVYFSIGDDNDIGKISKVSSFNADLLDSLPDRCCIVENRSTGEYKCLVTDPEYKQYVPATIKNQMAVEVDDKERQRPHLSGDDGIADAAFPV